MYYYILEKLTEYDLDVKKIYSSVADNSFVDTF